VTYAFPTGIYNPQDIRELDSVLARFAKRAPYLPIYTPNATILENVERMSIGATSPMVEYLQNVTAYLIRALNDKGPLGTLTRSMMKMQIEYLGGMSTLTTGARDKKNCSE
jgi:hypothetical protein